MKGSHFTVIVIAAILTACVPAVGQSPMSSIAAPNSSTEITTATPRVPYSAFLDNVTAEKRTSDANTAALLHRYINTDMPAYWDETTWDFNGMSRVPGEGEIACGYFVTTLLLDLGFPLAHVRLAQEPSSVMINELTTNIKKFNSRDAMMTHIENQPEPAVYIVGLDFHTGFITAGDGEINFVHSNYIAREGVVTERAATSEALGQSGFFMLGSLTKNQELMMIWRAQ